MQSTNERNGFKTLPYFWTSRRLQQRPFQCLFRKYLSYNVVDKNFIGINMNEIRLIKSAENQSILIGLQGHGLQEVWGIMHIWN